MKKKCKNLNLKKYKYGCCRTNLEIYTEFHEARPITANPRGIKNKQSDTNFF